MFMVRPTIHYLMAKQVTWVIITIKIIVIHVSHSPWMLELLESLLIWCIWSIRLIFYNMPKLVTVVILYIMHKRNKWTLIPLESNWAPTVIFRSKRSSESRWSLRFYFVLYVLLLHWRLVLFCSIVGSFDF